MDSCVIQINCYDDEKYDDCCICLSSLNCLNGSVFTTNCCKKQIHKSCISTWFLYKADFICPLCNSEKVRMTLKEIKKYKDNLSMTPTIYILNIEQLEEKYKFKMHSETYSETYNYILSYFLVILYVLLMFWLTAFQSRTIYLPQENYNSINLRGTSNYNYNYNYTTF
jgi:hypothetical protein